MPEPCDQGRPTRPECLRDPAIVAGFLQDAAGTPGGHSPGLVRPRSTEEVAAFLAGSQEPVLVVGARSSLTGAATPFGEILLSTDLINHLEIQPDGCFRAGAGLRMRELARALAEHGRFFAAAPTYDGASLGGMAATGAAGAATFKYGTVRAGITGLTAVLADGDLLKLRRGECLGTALQGFDAPLKSGRRLRAELPEYRDPPGLPKVSAGYAAPARDTGKLDLLDLLIGSEGTLAVIRALPLPAGVLSFLALGPESLALEIAGCLRQRPKGLSVRAIEHFDQGSLTLLKRHGAPENLGIRLPEDAGMALLAEIEIDNIEDSCAIESATLEILERFRVADSAIVAAPGDEKSRTRLLALREAVPRLFNEELAAAKRRLEPRLSKMALDDAVPFEKLGEHLMFARESLTRRGLSGIIFGHISDGNLHINVETRSMAAMERAAEALIEIGTQAIALGGSPMAEHGTGRHPVKRELLRRFRGDLGLGSMRRIKSAFDPWGRLAPGVLFDGS